MVQFEKFQGGQTVLQLNYDPYETTEEAISRLTKKYKFPSEVCYDTERRIIFANCEGTNSTLPKINVSLDNKREPNKQIAKEDNMRQVRSSPKMFEEKEDLTKMLHVKEELKEVEDRFVTPGENKKKDDVKDEDQLNKVEPLKVGFGMNKGTKKRMGIDKPEELDLADSLATLQNSKTGRVGFGLPKRIKENKTDNLAEEKEEY